MPKETLPGVLVKLSSSLGHRDESANIRLAKEIVLQKDGKAIQQLIAGLKDKNKQIQSDCIKVIYEVGSLNPGLISEYVEVFLGLLTHKNNRLQWGGMTALQSITASIPDEIYRALPWILKAAKEGTVITKDGAVQLLITLAGIKKFRSSAFNLLLDLLAISLPNQTPMYAERMLPLIDKSYSGRFIKILQVRWNDMEKQSQKTRVEKIINKTVKLTKQQQ